MTPTPLPQSGLLATVWRSGALESWHRGALAVVQNNKIILSVGDATRQIWCRSAVKPLQCLPLLRLGGVERFALSAPQIAVICGSHAGTDEHVALVRALLQQAGLDESYLQCGPHAPFDKTASLALSRSGNKPLPIHNNCSGKHSGFLMLSQILATTPLSEYLDPQSSPQQEVLRTVSDYAGVAVSDIGIGLDGCGAPTLRLPLNALAQSFARLAQCATPESALAVEAMTAHPRMASGPGRFCAALMEQSGGMIVAKNGAEGVYAFGIRGQDLGVAIKIDDGQERAYFPVLVHLLQHLGVWTQIPVALRDFAEVPLFNTQKKRVGHVKNDVDFNSAPVK